MSASQRSKGQRGERELFHLLTDHLGVTVTRNLDQVWQGGADTLDIPNWAIEVKRQEALSIASWWAQAQRQAERTGRKPALFYRQSRKPWRVVMDLHHIAPEIFTTAGSLCEMALCDACTVIRESLGGAL